MEKKIKQSRRTRVRFSPNEMVQLGKYIKEDFSAYTNIKLNTGIARTTILRVMSTGSAEWPTAIKLRDFLKLLKESA